MTPHEQEQQQRDAALRLGYGAGVDAVACMNAAHDAYHLALSRMLGLDESPTLRWVATGEPAHPTRHEDAIGVEEDMALGLQAFVQTGEFNGAIRILWWFGLDPETVRAQLMQLQKEGIP